MFIKWDDKFVPHLQVHLMKISNLKIVLKTLTTNKNNNWNKLTKKTYNKVCAIICTEFTSVLIVLCGKVFKIPFNKSNLLILY